MSGFVLVWIGIKYLVKRQLLSVVNTENELFRTKIDTNNANISMYWNFILLNLWPVIFAI